MSARVIAQHFFTRENGVSTGLYAGLNCGAGSADTPENVAENKRRVAAHFDLPANALVTLKQIHSADVVTVTAPFGPDDRPEADALVTNQPDIILGILTADCVPVLLRDDVAGVIGAAHAGWKGAYSGVVKNTIAAMQQLGAEISNIKAYIGPSIAQESYEVGPEFQARLVEETPENTQFFIPSTRVDHAMFDLKSYVAAKLAAADIQNVEVHADDTCAMEEKYFSYRRSCLRKEADYGRQISCIVIKSPKGE